MKRLLIFSLFLLSVSVLMYAGKYVYSFTDTPLSEALVRISREHPELRLSFIYDELGSYRTSARINSDDGAEAVRELASKLPVRVMETRGGIYVEAMQRGLYRYTGRVTGEDARGISHATVMVLAPKDSAVLTYAVTGNDGRFSIPCDVRNAILKLSSVGYVTAFHRAKRFNVGDIGLKVRPVALKEITIKTDNSRIESDRTVFIPGKREKNAAHGGVHLLMAMGIPTIRVNPVDKSVTTNTGDGVSVFIDYLPADSQQLTGMRTQDVKRVEVYDNPQDPRFNGARHVVNFIMVRYEYGGYTKLDALQKFLDTRGDYSLNSKFSYKKLTLDASAGAGYRHLNHYGSRTRTDYKFDSGDVTRISETERMHYSNNSEYATLRAVCSDKEYVISNTIGYQGSGYRQNSASSNSYSPEVFTSGLSEYTGSSRSNSANWRGAWSFFLPLSFTLSVTPALSYSHHDNFALYDSDGVALVNDAREDAWEANLNASCKKQWGRNSFSFGLSGEYSDDRLRYDGSDPYDSRYRSCALGTRLSGWFEFGRFWFSPSARIYYSHTEFDGERYVEWLPGYYVQIGYNFNDSHKFQMSSELSNWTVGVAQRSSNIVQRNLLDAVTGNPSLKTYMYNAVGAQHQWKLSRNVFLSFFGKFRRWTKPITDVYTPVVIDGRQMMLRSLIKDGYYNSLEYGASASLNLFDNSLSAWASVSGTYDRRGGRRTYSGNYISARGGINYYLKNVYFSFYCSAPSRGMSMSDQYIWSPSWYELSAGWSYAGFNISVSGSNFFRSSDLSGKSRSVYDNYSTVSQDFSRIYSRTFTLEFSYSFSYGKKVHQDNGPGRTGEISSGILK